MFVIINDYEIVHREFSYRHNMRVKYLDLSQSTVYVRIYGEPTILQWDNQDRTFFFDKIEMSYSSLCFSS